MGASMRAYALAPSARSANSTFAPSSSPIISTVGVAAALIEPLTRAVTTLATHQAQFEAFDAPNGWGTWENFLLFLARLLQACKDNPKVEVSR